MSQFPNNFNPQQGFYGQASQGLNLNATGSVNSTLNANGGTGTPTMTAIRPSMINPNFLNNAGGASPVPVQSRPQTGNVTDVQRHQAQVYYLAQKMAQSQGLGQPTPQIYALAQQRIQAARLHAQAQQAQGQSQVPQAQQQQQQHAQTQPPPQQPQAISPAIYQQFMNAATQGQSINPSQLQQPPMGIRPQQLLQQQHQQLSQSQSPRPMPVNPALNPALLNTARANTPSASPPPPANAVRPVMPITQAFIPAPAPVSVPVPAASSAPAPISQNTAETGRSASPVKAESNSAMNDKEVKEEKKEKKEKKSKKEKTEKVKEEEKESKKEEAPVTEEEKLKAEKKAERAAKKRIKDKERAEKLKAEKAERERLEKEGVVADDKDKGKEAEKEKAEEKDDKHTKDKDKEADDKEKDKKDKDKEKDSKDDPAKPKKEGKSKAKSKAKKKDDNKEEKAEDQVDKSDEKDKVKVKDKVDTPAVVGDNDQDPDNNRDKTKENAANDDKDKDKDSKDDKGEEGDKAPKAKRSKPPRTKEEKEKRAEARRKKAAAEREKKEANAVFFASSGGDAAKDKDGGEKGTADGGETREGSVAKDGSKAADPRAPEAKAATAAVASAEARSRKHEGMRGSMRNEIARLMYGAGDVPEPDVDTVDYMEDMVTEFLADLCRPIQPMRLQLNMLHQPVPLSFDVVRHRLASTPHMSKYLERYDHMVYMSDVLKSHRRIANPNLNDLVETVGNDYLGLDDDNNGHGTSGSGGGAGRKRAGEAGENGAAVGERKRGRMMNPNRPLKLPGEKRKPGPQKGWKLNRDPDSIQPRRQTTGDPNAPKRKYMRKSGGGGGGSTAASTPGGGVKSEV
ncbi:hypothetical protein I316_05279 [Kwoniella heveanensis BCC8398]|uniref:Uncharacterized protein n=1 Tax=Kwoniella heveanensis BCC8398 TaxID=1296120 RepID=A0A1B9GPG0_9TREE|nr:hypothetical protein I316_05279 [Kwoniella heveanensis BCC8398]